MQHDTYTAPQEKPIGSHNVYYVKLRITLKLRIGPVRFPTVRFPQNAEANLCLKSEGNPG